ncbi:MAG TPA: tetratricopeptide repeat protein [Gemmatimonadaceae bacterium]|nr:tetratricopeptide repeat protein [Gemmatimonadaceae bacterium]
MKGKLAGVFLGFVFALIGLPLGYLVGVRGAWLLLSGVVVGGIAGALVYFVSTRVAVGGARAVAAFVHPSGSSTPYEHAFSAHDALELAGDVAGAIDAYEATLREHPANARALRQAGELHVRAGNAARAAELFAAMRRTGASREDELYATQRLADLYLGPLGDDGRALVELRRVVERFPGTRESEGARTALRRLKGARGDGGPSRA